MPFWSVEFKRFAYEWGFKIANSSPHYPKSNDQAESAIKSFLKKECDLSVALLSYRVTPIINIALSPLQIKFSRQIKAKLPTHVNFFNH